MHQTPLKNQNRQNKWLEWNKQTSLQKLNLVVFPSEARKAGQEQKKVKREIKKKRGKNSAFDELPKARAAFCMKVGWYLL